MAELKLDFAPLEPRIAQGPRATAGEAMGAAFTASRLVGSRADAARTQINVPQMSPRGQFLDNSTRTERMTIASDFADMPDDLRSDLVAQGFDPNSGTLADVREWQRQRDQAIYEEQQEVLSRADGVAAAVAGFGGAFGAEMLDPLNLATLPVGASARAGFLATVGVESVLNASIEGLQTPSRNAALLELGQEETGILNNVLFGAAFGAAGGGLIRGAQLTAPHALESFKSVGSMFRRPEDQRLMAEVMQEADDEAVREVARALENDVDEIEAGTGGAERGIQEITEHESRAATARAAADRGETPDMPDRPLDAVPRYSILNGEIEEVDPRDLVVDPETFQFKSDAGADGLTAKLRDVPAWRPERAGVVLVYESADGVRFIADGHQRTGLARRIMDSDPAQEIRLAAKVFREADDFTAEDVRVIAALKNIAEAADGMTVAMARDAAKVLRIDPDAIRELPAGSGIRRAQELTNLSDDAFALVINEVIPDNLAAVVGRLVDDPAMHMPIMRLLERTNPSTEAQAVSIVRQALAAPVEREVTEDLFGTTDQIESLYLERAKVLERTMKILRDDDRTFRTLTERGDTIEGRAGNRLDAEGNAAQRKQIETAMAAIQKLAYRAGPISEALDNGAKTIKEGGKVSTAASEVAAAIQRQIERDGIAGLGDGPTGRNAQPTEPRAATPDPNAGFADPNNGPDVDQQIANTRLDANERPAEGFSSNEEARRDLGRRVSAGAAREELDSHPAVVEALDELQARAEVATNLSEVYDTPQWHSSREYVFGNDVVTGTDAALMRWVGEAESFAGDTVRRERVATIVLGPPAAGKSTIAEDLARTKGAAILDSDEINKALPEFEGGIGAAAVHEESSDLADQLEVALRATGTNIVYPKVGGSPESIQRAIARFKADGYQVELVNMAVTKENAYKRMIGRFVATGRLIPPSYVDAVGDSPTSTYRAVKNESGVDGYAEIDNNVGFKDAKPITDQGGERNPLAGSSYDIPAGGEQAVQRQQEPRRADPQNDGGAQVEQTDAGSQMLIDGVAPITAKERVQTAADKPLTAQTRTTDSEIGGPFDANDPARVDLFDQVPVGRREVDGDMRAETVSRSELMDELNADDDFADQLGFCLK
jgi:predicted kinase